MRLRIPSPTRLGLPAKFTSWRPNQEAAIGDLLEQSGDMVIAHAHPTGAGKSLIYMAAARVIPEIRTVILTSTKALQDQLASEFAGIAADIRGQNAYNCKAVNGVSCADGPCRSGFVCPHKESKDCPYQYALEKARSSQIVVTNYSYWLYSNRYGDGLGPVDRLVLDEAHDAPRVLADFLTVTLTEEDLHKTLRADLPKYRTIQNWKRWAQITATDVEEALASVTKILSKGTMSAGALESAARLRRLLHSLESLCSEVGNDWVFKRDQRGVRFGAVTMTAGQTKRFLFGPVDSVYMTSATISPTTLQLLGNVSVRFREFPEVFPKERRWVTAVSCPRLRHDSTEADLSEWCERIDKVLENRLDRKGIIHCHAYSRRDFLAERSRFRDHFFTNSRHNTRDVLAEFKRAKPPAIFVSPSLVAGYDFPHDECRFQIVAKLPFPNMQDALFKARIDRVPELLHYLTAQSVVQAAGRGVRSVDDYCETFIMDGNFGAWWWEQNRYLTPKWFRESVRFSRTVPFPEQALPMSGDEHPKKEDEING